MYGESNVRFFMSVNRQVCAWWNPAVEAQATDRAHRIGQKRVVTSYKLIARDTVEEKILALQERKRDMIASTLGDGSPGADLGLDEEEILGLFG